MTTIPIPIVNTPRLTLIEMTANDLDSWAHLIFADSEVMQYMPGSVTHPHARATHRLGEISTDWREHGYGVWKVIERSSGAFAGYCGLGYLPETNETEIDYGFARPHWGKGYATEAVRASLKFAVDYTKIQRVIGLVMPGNKASANVLVKCGFAFVKCAAYFGYELDCYEINRGKFTQAELSPGKNDK